MTMTPPLVECWEVTDVVWMARIQGANGADLTQATTTTINYYVYNDSTGAVVGTPATLVVATVIFNTLQTAAPWTKDATGYNFKWQIPTTLLPNAASSIIYRVEVIITTSSADKIAMVQRIARSNLISQV